MKICIVGSRSITDRNVVFNTIYKFLDEHGLLPAECVLLSGGANGVDSLVGEFARENGVDFVLFKPYHMLDNKAEFKTKYFFVRNRQMIDNADEVLVIWDGKSRGAAHAKEYAEKCNKDVTTVIVQ
jgi:predicted Rossmann fold nucleotide-binding protein DprA/Smf involved in DNA uptake